MKDTDEILYQNNTKLILELLDKWSRAKPDNKELRATIDSFWEITTYVANLKIAEQDARLEASDNKHAHNLTKLQLKDIEQAIKQVLNGIPYIELPLIKNIK